MRAESHILSSACSIEWLRVHICRAAQCSVAENQTFLIVPFLFHFNNFSVWGSIFFSFKVINRSPSNYLVTCTHENIIRVEEIHSVTLLPENLLQAELFILHCCVRWQLLSSISRSGSYRKGRESALARPPNWKHRCFSLLYFATFFYERKLS